MSNIKKFNITVGNLIDDLIIVCPTYEHLKTFKEQLNLLCKFNVRKSIEYFKNTVYIYKEQIVNKDENYFLFHHYSYRLIYTQMEYYSYQNLQDSF